MKKLLVILLTLVMLVSVLTACDGTNSDTTVDNGSSSDNDDGHVNGDTSVKEFVDVDYTPNPDGLIGVAIYTLTDETYPHSENEMIVIDGSIYSTMWEFYYLIPDSDGYLTESWGQYDVVDISLTEASVTYYSEAKLIWGYVYKVGDQEVIVATHDVINYNDDDSAVFTWTVTSENFAPRTRHFIVKPNSGNTEN